MHLSHAAHCIPAPTSRCFFAGSFTAGEFVALSDHITFVYVQRLLYLTRCLRREPKTACRSISLLHLSTWHGYWSRLAEDACNTAAPPVKLEQTTTARCDLCVSTQNSCHFLVHSAYHRTFCSVCAIGACHNARLVIEKETRACLSMRYLPTAVYVISGYGNCE